MHRDDKFSTCETDIQPMSAESAVLPGNPHQLCDFCGKLVAPGDSKSVLERLSGPGRFFCDFCLRQKHNAKGGRNILVLSYRGLIAYLYYESYVSLRIASFTEIEDAIEDHVNEGLRNPVFAYDPETMLWFIDFSRVGQTKKKLPVEEVKATVNSILKKLRLSALIQSVQCSKLELKYADAVDVFYQKRSRPQTRRLFIPTLKGCGVLEPKGQHWDKHKDFIRPNMLVRLG